jgi:hypothetical protein
MDLKLLRIGKVCATEHPRPLLFQAEGAFPFTGQNELYRVEMNFTIAVGTSLERQLWPLDDVREVPLSRAEAFVLQLFGPLYET